MTPFRFMLAASAVALLAGCSSPPAPDRVATLPTAGSATTSAVPADPDNGRPRERIDMTNAEAVALSDIYETCMAQNGFEKAKISTLPDPDQAAAKARAACVSKDPLPPWELDASNPHAADFVHAVVQCLRAKGVKYVNEEPPQDGRMLFSFGGPENDSASITKGMELTPACEKDVATQGIGK
ncbi:hypothetical protein [Amycolatopsis sp. NPDC051061]|uniref:hypothetical protein n=1 Tax=Amycolatopsis sp. NPDC051061 TaxID=3155042 RepID=UPI0034424279